ncbi:hypothetical protein DYB28_002960 [Aphanomyces astaci]|uniref:WRKY transcription factor 19 n=2 Tax=Aphanomyces astaci TaxID=112090 RepID=A0A397DU60_APHAT|nr:hypothetical protein DYB36_005207 [Aphanomyces astaci]RHY70780.1 hypothetical protein DYB38_007297 [Aphanomyces astaci]RHY71612.1 hypothetical protein DYB34_012933 [Aphanomyces astaci]RHY95085.1 hypothetical protein DYB31_010627 [Aphanomyces astaci]RLO04762.1 hypothetical protein DYB28_002960 [Aphanomyces astaci]
MAVHDCSGVISNVNSPSADTMSSDRTCLISGCNDVVMHNSWRCKLHRHRGMCIIDNCTNQAYARQLCCRHGAKKECAVDGCNLRARLDNVCYKHGATKKLCTEVGCTQPAQARQRCVKHGGGRQCKRPGCTAHARTGGFCQRHRTSSDVPTPLQLLPTVTASKGGINMTTLWGDTATLLAVKATSPPTHNRCFSMDSATDVSQVNHTYAPPHQPSMMHLIQKMDHHHTVAPLQQQRWDPLHYHHDTSMLRGIFELMDDL